MIYEILSLVILDVIHLKHIKEFNRIVGIDLTSVNFQNKEMDEYKYNRN